MSPTRSFPEGACCSSEGRSDATQQAFTRGINMPMRRGGGREQILDLRLAPRLGAPPPTKAAPSRDRGASRRPKPVRVGCVWVARGRTRGAPISRCSGWPLMMPQGRRERCQYYSLLILHVQISARDLDFNSFADGSQHDGSTLCHLGVLNIHTRHG